MKTQMDHKYRVVTVANLEAMCERISGVCHRFEVSKVSRSRVHVEYSNPNEYGTETPMTAVFPCYPGAFADADNPYVVLDMVRVIGDTWDGEGWQAFTPLLDCPTLWRDPASETWKTHAEIGESPEPRVDTCTICDLHK